MDYYGIGYSNIRLPNSSKSYVYRYNTKINTFPEEVYTLKPAKNTNFKYSYDLDEFHEPQNFIEGINQLFRNLVHNAKNIGNLFNKNKNQNMEINNVV